MACRLWLADVCCVQLTGKQRLVDTTGLTGWSNYLVDSRVSGQVNKHDSVCWKVQAGRLRCSGWLGLETRLRQVGVSTVGSIGSTRYKSALNDER